MNASRLSVCSVSCVVSSAVFTCLGQTVDHPLQIGGDVKPPALVHQIDPKFSRKMREQRGEKTVLVHLIVDEKGMPAKVHVLVREADCLTADPAFSDSALKAVEKYRFRPATLQNEPVAVEINVEVHFQILGR